MKFRTWHKWLIVLGVGVLIFMTPRPEGITNEAWILLAVFIATIVGSIVQPLNGAAMVLLGVVALAFFRAVPIEKAFSGYSDKFVWLVLAAFFYLARDDQDGARASDRPNICSAHRSANARSWLFACFHGLHSRIVHSIDWGTPRRDHSADCT